ncbi:MAG: GNAT family N-acetyltransferase [Rikenellaceae bacterium]
MIDFHPITLADRATIERYTLSSDMRDCNLSFANMYCWRSQLRSAWAVVDGWLLIRFSIDGGNSLGYMQPLGLGAAVDFSPIIPVMAQDAHSHNQRLRIIGVNGAGREVLRESYGGDFALHSDPNFEDYIYRREALASLSGKRLQPKRNHINQFLKRCADYEYRPLTPDQFDECLRLDCRWRAAHGECCEEMTPEREAMMRAFRHFEELGLRGGALYVEGKLAAFTYGSQINSDTFCVHVEKGEREVLGCYTVINKLFAESLPDNFIYINREEDLGIEGLKRAKLSYYPDHLQQKFRAIYLHHDEKECKRLWQSLFGDDDDFVDEFLQHHYSQQRMLRVVDSDNRYHSMLHIVPFETVLGRVAYIYGVATAEEARHRGHASQLMKRAMELIEADGYAAAVLIPSEEWLRGYYTRFGFEGSVPTTFEAYNGFDFGSGDTAQDLAMIATLSESCELPKDLVMRRQRDL